MKATATHYADDFSTGERVAFRIDPDGDVEISTPRGSEGDVWLSPEDMVRVMTALGFRVSVAEKPAERRPDASARVRASWLRKAAEDDTERAEIAVHATTRRLQRAQRKRALERARQERVRLEGRRFYRDRLGRVWVTGPDPERVYRVNVAGQRSGHGFRRASVERIVGPLRREDIAAEGIVAALRAQAQRDKGKHIFGGAW